MSDQIAIEQGRHPWSPARDADLVEVLHFYDIPLIGVIREGGSFHLFRCIEGQVDPSSLWAYTRLSETEFETVRSASPADLDDAIDSVSQGRPAVVALADEDRGVLVSALVPDPTKHRSLLHAAREALRALSTEVDDRLARSST